MQKKIRIGTRESQLAVWQATTVQQLLHAQGVASELVYIKSEGDVDTVTPLYALGVQGVFTKALDAALLNNRIDIAVHSMKDVPVQLAQGIQQAAVLERASYKDIFVYNGDVSVISSLLETPAINHSPFTLGTSSIRRKAQWLHRYPHHTIENLRGNVNTRLRKVAESNWNGAIFAAAGLERIEVRPENSFDLDWMLPAPAQGAIMIVCKEGDNFCLEACAALNHPETATCVKAERDFLKILMGGCSTPISALAEIKNDTLIFKGNVCSTDGKQKFDVEHKFAPDYTYAGTDAANELLQNQTVQQLIAQIRNAKQ